MVDKQYVMHMRVSNSASLKYDNEEEFKDFVKASLAEMVAREITNQIMKSPNTKYTYIRHSDIDMTTYKINFTL